jgi:hypothetical protein
MKPPKTTSFGQCHICGDIQELTFEHVPPKVVGNNGESRMYNALDIIRSKKAPWEFRGLQYKAQHRGSGGYTLCKQCNDLTGQRYVPAFSKFYREVVSHNVHPFTVRGMNIYWSLQITFKPLETIKEILAMIASVSPPGLLSSKAVLQKLILDTSSSVSDIGNFPYKMYAYLSKTNMQKMFGPMALVGTNGRSTVILGIDVLPLSFRFELEGDYPNDYCEITSWFTYRHDEELKLAIELPCLEENNVFPLDHRSRSEILSVGTKK